jgi:NADPH:quinone reductase-like Zn-dependent oxidoreductase
MGDDERKMNAARIHEFGPPDVLSYERMPRPEPHDDEVLVRVRAAGVNPVDCRLRRGVTTQMLADDPFPLVLGMDIAGVVEETGAAVTDFERGDAVFGVNGFPDFGGYAEYATTSTDQLAPKPDVLTFTEAAGVPVVAQTAWQALFEYADCTAGDRVLIHGAAGGVGHMAVQLATSTGAEVIATASGYSERYLRELGVDEFVNYREAAFESVVDPVDIVVDTVGGETQRRSVDVLADGGVLVSVVGAPSDPIAEGHDIAVQAVSGRSEHPALLTRIGEAIDDGALRPTVSTEIPLSEAARAHEIVETEHVRGKLVLDV